MLTQSTKSLPITANTRNKIKKTYIVSQLGSISFVHKEAAETIPSSCLHFSLSFFSWSFISFNSTITEYTISEAVYDLLLLKGSMKYVAGAFVLGHHDFTAQL